MIDFLLYVSLGIIGGGFIGYYLGQKNGRVEGERMGKLYFALEFNDFLKQMKGKEI